MRKIIILLSLIFVSFIGLVPSAVHAYGWITLAPSPERMSGNGMVYDGVNYVYVIGGRQGTWPNWTYSNRFERYSISTNTWEVLDNAPIHMLGTQAFYKSGNIIVLPGGSPDSGEYSSCGGCAVLNYNIASSLWSPLQPMPYSFAGGSAFDGSRYIYTFSVDEGNGYVQHFLRYDIQQNSWVDLPQSNDNLVSSQGAVDGQGRYYRFGGWNVSTHTVSDILQRFDPSQNSWGTVSTIPIPMGYGIAVYDGNDNFYVTPGHDNIQKFYKYTISTNTWVILPDMPTLMDDNRGIWDGNGVIMSGGIGLVAPDNPNDVELQNTFYKFDILTNHPPIVGFITAPTTPQQVNTNVNASANFTDVDTTDTHTVSWNWGDSFNSAGSVTESNGTGLVTGSHIYTTPGVYTVTLTVTDDDLASDSEQFMYIVVYDPNGGFVTGAGRFNMLAGSIVNSPTESGMTNFGTNAKYVNNVLTGSTRLMFRDGQLSFNFDSTSYDWLVVNGTTATLHGLGTVDGSGSYAFTLTATDSPDTFRLQIYNGQTLVYDNGTSIPTNGNIEVHN